MSLSRVAATPSQVSKELRIPLSKVSLAIRQLTEAGILQKRKGYGTLSLDVSLKEAIKTFLNDFSEDKLIDTFFGVRLNVLFQISESYDTMEKLILITGYPARSLKRILKELQDALLIYQPKISYYHIRRAEKDKINVLKSVLMSHFLNSLAKKNLTWKKISIFGNHILIESNMELIPGFVKTSFSRFHEYHVGLFLTSYSNFINSTRKQSREEVFIHALAESKGDYRYLMYCTLFADLNRLTLQQLGALPIVFKVEKEAKQIFDYITSGGKSKTNTDFLTPYKEYLEVRRDYEK